MSRFVSRVPFVLSLIIGVMAVVAGGQVIFFGEEKDYHVIGWLVRYNFGMGLVTVLLTAVLIWKNSRFALPAAAVTLSCHLAVMLLLQTVYKSEVASHSVTAMTVRLIVWTVIVVLLFLHSRKRL